MLVFSRPSYQCPSMFCDTPMVHHIRRFVHGSGCVQIVLKELDSPVPGYQHTILTYSWCRICKQVGDSSRKENRKEPDHFFAALFIFFSSFFIRLHQWCLSPTSLGPCLLPNTWSSVSTGTSTLGGPTRSPVDTPSTKTTTSTSLTTRWWPPSGQSALAFSFHPTVAANLPALKLKYFPVSCPATRQYGCWRFVFLVPRS